MTDFIIEHDDYFSIRFEKSEIIFEFEDSQERADQYQNAINYLLRLVALNQINEKLEWVNT